MNAENQAPFVREMAGIVTTLSKNAEEQQATAEEALARLTRAAVNLDRAANECRAFQKTVQENVDAKIRDAMEGAASEAAKLLASKFSVANKQAELAAERYECAARTIGLRLAAMIIVACVVTLGLATYLIRHSYPSQAEMQALRDERQQLQETISILDSRGGRAITTCVDAKQQQHLCAYVINPDTKQVITALLSGY